MRRVLFAILCVSVSTLCDEVEDFTQKNLTQDLTQNSTKILSRRKRYLIFPEGSSLQLVYCLTMPVIGRSTIFTIGGTAALAWELPHDPFKPYRKPAELLHRKDPPGKYTILDPPANKKQSLVSKVSQSPIDLLETFDQLAGSPIRYDVDNGYQNSLPTSVRFPSINYSPAYNRYRYQNYQNRRRQQFPQQQQFSTGNTGGWKVETPVYYRFTQPKLPIQLLKDRVTSVHNALSRKTNADSGVLYYNSPEASGISGVTPSNSRESIYHQVHRRTRRDLYGKIEKFLSTQVKDSKACLLRTICELHQSGEEKGSFMIELMKTVFRVKPSENYKDEDIYDDAANKHLNCMEIYANCDSSILNYI